MQTDQRRCSNSRTFSLFCLSVGISAPINANEDLNNAERFMICYVCIHMHAHLMHNVILIPKRALPGIQLYLCFKYCLPAKR